jgi:hypothetical protein
LGVSAELPIFETHRPRPARERLPVMAFSYGTKFVEHGKQHQYA